MSATSSSTLRCVLAAPMDFYKAENCIQWGDVPYLDEVENCGRERVQVRATGWVYGMMGNVKHGGNSYMPIK